MHTSIFGNSSNWSRTRNLERTIQNTWYHKMSWNPNFCPFSTENPCQIIECPSFKLGQRWNLEVIFTLQEVLVTTVQKRIFKSLQLSPLNILPLWQNMNLMLSWAYGFIKMKWSEPFHEEKEWNRVSFQCICTTIPTQYTSFPNFFLNLQAFCCSYRIWRTKTIMHLQHTLHIIFRQCYKSEADFFDTKVSNYSNVTLCNPVFTLSLPIFQNP